MELIAEPKEAENTEILKIYKSLDQKIICHCYASFKIEEKNQKALVLLTEANMMFYFDSGENYITALPFEVLKIYAVEGGILMEQGEGKDFGRLFTLFHPNEQVKKVSVCDQAEEFDLGNVLLVRDEYIVTHTFDGISIYNIVINNSEFDLDMELDESGFSFEVEDQKSTLKLRLFSKLKVSVATSDVIWFLKDHTSTQILWILSREYQLLTGYSLKVAEVKERFKYTVHDACEFQCPLASGILALYPDGTTKMWIGYEDMIPCHINLAKLESKAKPKRSLSEPKDDSMIEIKSSKGVRVIGVETSPESGFVNLKLSDGTQTLARAKVIFHSNLITSLVDQIAYVVSPAEFVVFYSRLLFTTFGEINKTEHLNYWESFVVVFLSFLHDGLESSSVITKQDEADDFDWLIRNQKLNIFPECVTRNLKNETEPKSMGRLFNISVRVHRRFHHEPTLLPHISQLIIAFHLVYQDLLLDVSLKLQLDQLGDFMAQLLAGNQFQSYYLGLGYHSNSDSLPILAFNLDILDLPTITDWIYHLIATQLPQEHITTILTTLSDKDISSHKGLYLLKNISTLYTILFQKGPHSMILHFVDSECLANIDHLPVAIALTLRQAIHNCRNHPQSLAGNEAACRMIGRKDLAKNATDSIHFDKEERKKIVDLRFGKDDRVLQVTELLNPIADAVIEVPLKANMRYHHV